MITITEYNAHVQELKKQFQKQYGKIQNPKTVAVVTAGIYIDKFILKLRTLLETVGVDLHWYHYSQADMKELDMDLEIQDLKEAYNEVTVFRTEVGYNNEFAFAALGAIKDLMWPVAGRTFCIKGKDTILVNILVNRLVEEGVDFAIMPSNTWRRADYLLLLDDSLVYTESYIDIPVIELFSWNSLVEKAYDLSDEIAIRMGGILLGR